MRDCTLRWGWNYLDWTKTSGHTFAAIANGPWFDYCGHAGLGGEYPAGEGPATRRLAETIWCGTPNDPGAILEGDYSIRKCNAGVVCGVNGICHQAINRVLWETGMTVTRAPGWFASYLLYGVYGDGWTPYLAMCIALAGWSGTRPQYSDLTQRMVDNDAESSEKPADALYQNRVRLLVEERLGAGYSEAEIRKLTEILLEAVEK